ncbi:hypothetical protein OIU84_005380 [Salix udensis]|uniref:Uncharacterized protein n=1 Tax=Salix udensis TaxID=889485 RepID=A0AAD6JVW6_9ROSI|nr:hypothetical protein OIU84_005380 [Salix udensis]
MGKAHCLQCEIEKQKGKPPSFLTSSLTDPSWSPSHSTQTLMNFIIGSVSFTAECFCSLVKGFVEIFGISTIAELNHKGPAKFGSAPSKHFGDINCRTFHSGAGLLPPPFQTSTTPATKSTTHAPPASHPPKTPPPAAKSHSVDIGRFKTASKSSPITINVKSPRKEISFNEEMGFVNENLLFSELWAGPAYSNSPPPSSLPIPKFSMRPPKRTVSLDSPVSDYADFDVQPTVKSAPASPSREHSPCIRDMFLSADSATKTLRRILNLDVADE